MKSEIRKNNTGFTLIEVLVALGISSLALIFLTKLFSTSLSSCTLQDQLSEMNQNARYSIKELGDVLIQAGADLQIINVDSLDKDTVIIPDNNEAHCTGFTIKVNPRGGIFEIPQTTNTAICTLKVGDARKYRHAGYLARIPGVRSTQGVKVYTIQNLDTVSNMIVFSPPDSFIQGDAVCSFTYRRYFLNGTDLCVNSESNVLAENIDSLSILFQDKDGNPTPNWPLMHSVDLLVRARNERPDRRYNEYPDHYRRVTLTYKFRMRNKIED
jgi:prepilin-type N-terminal cleavage/methylation domain-containing protein